MIPNGDCVRLVFSLGFENESIFQYYRFFEKNVKYGYEIRDMWIESIFGPVYHVPCCFIHDE